MSLIVIKNVFFYRTFLCVLALLIVSATIHELLHCLRNAGERSMSFESKSTQFLQCFSLVKNVRKLTGPSPTGELSCLHGIRSLTMAWLILTHLTEDTYARFTINKRGLYEVCFNDLIFPISVIDVHHHNQDGFRWYMQIITNGSVAVDTFFFISSFLATRSWLQDFDRGRARRGTLYFFLHRYLR